MIASLGLIANSAAVVIGAMLVAPLMEPIVAVAVALVLGDSRRQLVSAGLILFASLESIGFAALVASVVPSLRVLTITPEILSRTAPGVLDLAIAVAAGAAGAYVTVRRPAAGALPGTPDTLARRVAERLRRDTTVIVRWTSGREGRDGDGLALRTTSGVSPL